MSAPRIEPLGRDRRDEVLDLDQWAFLYDDSEVDAEGVTEALEWDRTFGAFLPDPASAPGDTVAAERLAGIFSVYSLQMGLPAPTGRPLPLLPVAGLTWVGVHPQLRRRGVMTAMIRHHLDQVRAAGREPVSVLFAAEAAIYGRFGYGLAGRLVGMTVGRGSSLRPIPGQDTVSVRLERVEPGRHTDLIAGVLEQTAPRRPGSMVRPRPGLRRYALEDLPVNRKGRESLRIAVATTQGQVSGYAVFARRADWSGGRPTGLVHVRELEALDVASEAALWARLLDLDLTETVHTGRRPVDDVLLQLLVDPRAADPRLSDGQYVRVVDLPAALQARRYSCEVDVVLEVTDSLLPGNAGRWHLTAGPDHSLCQRTDAAPAVTLDVRELGAAYLGGESLAAFARAGLVTTTDPAALDAASTAFRSPVAPGGSWVF